MTTPLSRLMYDRIASDADRRKAFEAILREDNHGSLDRYCWNAARFFGVDLRGKRILEIGSGKGVTSMFMALQGAHVVSLEPGLAGSRHGLQEIQQRRLAALRLEDSVEALAADFNVWDAQGRTFDVIVSESSINHLHESPHHALKHRDTHEQYQRIMRKTRSLLAPGGVFLVTDACRYGFFPLVKPLGIRRPWRKGRKTSTNWRIHQNAGVWKTIALTSGYSAVEIDYPLPFSLKAFGALVANPVTNFFLRSRFLLKAFA